MKLSFRTKLLLSFGILLLLPSFFGWKLNQVLTNSERDTKLIIHTHVVVELLQEIQTTMIGIQTGGRGYVITLNDEYLEPFHTGSKRIGVLLDSLRILTADNPKQRNNLDTLVQLVQSEIRFTSEVVQVAKNSGLDSSVNKIRTSRAQRRMELVLQVVKSMKHEDQQLIVDRYQVASESASDTKLMSFSSISLVFLYSALLFVSIQRYPSLLEKSHKVLEQQVLDQTSSLQNSNTELLREVDERKQAQELILSNEVKYRHTLDAMMEGCQIIGLDWRACISTTLQSVKGTCHGKSSSAAR